MKYIEFIKNQRIAILGFGKEGKSTLLFLKSIGVKDITILDSNLKINKLKDINYILGDAYLDSLSKFDLIIKSPGISPYNEKISAYNKKITTQTKIFFENYSGKVIGITGTKGKSTISTLTYKLLKKAGYNVKLVGNIGDPVLDEIKLSNDNYDYIVYELSSYMLEGFQPNLYIGILNNIFNDHLDWHGFDFENYKRAKLNIIKNSKYKLIGKQVENYVTCNKNTFFGGENTCYSHKNNSFFIKNNIIDGKINTSLLGEHNKDNFCAVLGICDILNIELNILFKIIEEFKGLSHRLENIGVYNGITFIDDAISTTPESTIAAINSIDNQIGTIILGGTDRGYDFVELMDTLSKYNIKNIALLPENGKQIKILISNNCNILETSNMDTIIEFAFKYCKKGEVCLLSTASPSYNSWLNYEKQGEDFKKSVVKYFNKNN